MNKGGRRIEQIPDRTVKEAELNEEEQECLRLALEGCTKEKESVAAAVRILIHRQQLQPKLYSYDYSEIHDISNCSVSKLRKYLTKYNTILLNRLIDADDEQKEASMMIPLESGESMEPDESAGSERDLEITRDQSRECSSDGSNGNNKIDAVDLMPPVANDFPRAESESLALTDIFEQTSEDTKPEDIRKLVPCGGDANAGHSEETPMVYPTPSVKEEPLDESDTESQAYDPDIDDASSETASRRSDKINRRRRGNVDKKERRPHDVDSVPVDIQCILNGEDVSAIVWHVCFGGSRYRSLSERIPLAVAVGRILMRQETAAEACMRTGIPQGTITNYERRVEVAVFKKNNIKRSSDTPNTLPLVPTPVRPPPLSLLNESKQLKVMKVAQMRRFGGADTDAPSAKKSRTIDPSEEYFEHSFTPEEVEETVSKFGKEFDISPNMVAAIRCVLGERASVKTGATRFNVLTNPLSLWCTRLMSSLRGETETSEALTAQTVVSPSPQQSQPSETAACSPITPPVTPSPTSGWRIPKKEKEVKDDSASVKSRSESRSLTKEKEKEDREQRKKREEKDREKERQREKEKEREREKEKEREKEREKKKKDERSREITPSESGESLEDDEELFVSDEVMDKVRGHIMKIVEFADVSPMYYCLSDAVLDVILLKKKIVDVSQNRRIPYPLLLTFVQMGITVLNTKGY